VASIGEVTAPLILRHPDGREELVAACFPHRLGLLYLDLYWHQGRPEETAHLIRGELSGDGPWRIGDHRIRTLGCANTDPQLRPVATRWEAYLRDHAGRYPPRPQLLDIARRLGALI